MAVQLLHYRPWRGKFASPLTSFLPIARLALTMMMRRRLFWALYALSMLIFLMYFFGQYLLFFAETQAEDRVRIVGISVDTRALIDRLRRVLRLNAEPEMYLNLFWYQGYMVMVILALAGSLLIGNDIRYGSLSFYLSKPISIWHYLLGKCLAIAIFVNLMTTLPAVLLFVQYSFLTSEPYLEDNWQMLLGILAFGLILSSFLSLLLVTVSIAVRRTVPLIMAWTTAFFFSRRLADVLVERLFYDPRFRLMDLWNNLYLTGTACLGGDVSRYYRQPQLWEAILTLGGVTLLCLIYLIRRIRAVEVIK